MKLKIKGLDSGFVETKKPDQKIVIEIDRQKRKFILREERMKRRPILIMTGVFSFLLLISCATAPPVPVKDYQPESNDEASIKEFFVNYENLYNAHDVDALGELFSPDAQILAGGRARKMVNTQEYLDMHRETFANNPDLRVELYSPKIKVNGDEAEATFKIESPGSGHTYIPPFTYYLVKENGSWLITGRKY